MDVYPLGGEWENEEEKYEVGQRILKLNDSQIAELFEKVGISWDAPMEGVIKEIRSRKKESVHLDILLTEADSKNNLIKWLSLFENKVS